MIRRCVLLIAVSILGFDRAAAGDIYPSQTSSNGAAKVTLFCVGTNHDKEFWEPFVVAFLLEDCRPKEEIQRNPGSIRISVSPNIYSSGTTGVSALLLYHSECERGGMYEYALQSAFRVLHSLVNIPKPEDPQRIGVYEFF